MLIIQIQFHLISMYLKHKQNKLSVMKRSHFAIFYMYCMPAWSGLYWSVKGIYTEYRISLIPWKIPMPMWSSKCETTHLHIGTQSQQKYIYIQLYMYIESSCKMECELRNERRTEDRWRRGGMSKWNSVGMWLSKQTNLHSWNSNPFNYTICGLSQICNHHHHRACFVSFYNRFN